MKQLWKYMSTGCKTSLLQKSTYCILTKGGTSTNMIGHSVVFRYCKQVYQKVPDPKGVFLTLLRIYLREPSSVTSSKSQSLQTVQKFFLDPAKDLISRHGARLDPVEVLELLPPLVSTNDVRGFLLEVLDGSTIHSPVTRELWKARRNEVDARLMSLRERRVKVAHTRM